MKCQYCNNLTRHYQINTQNNNNIYFPVCEWHESYKHKLERLPGYINPEQGLYYIKRKQLVSWIEQCQ